MRQANCDLSHSDSQTNLRSSVTTGAYGCDRFCPILHAAQDGMMQYTSRPPQTLGNSLKAKVTYG